MSVHTRTKGWMLYVLMLAGIWNIAWGLIVSLYPDAFFNWFGLPSPTYRIIWQGTGMVIGLYGLGYCISAFDPYRHWPIIFIGLLGKILGPLGFFYYYYIDKSIPFEFFYNLIFNDLIWWIPFGIIMWKIYRRRKI